MENMVAVFFFLLFNGYAGVVVEGFYAEAVV
jgi:hypothetical protein